MMAKKGSIPKQELLIEHLQKILEEDTRGLTIGELARSTKVSRITVSIALARLEGRDLIEVREIGNCKLHYLKKGGKRS